MDVLGLVAPWVYKFINEACAPQSIPVLTVAGAGTLSSFPQGVCPPEYTCSYRQVAVLTVSGSYSDGPLVDFFKSHLNAHLYSYTHRFRLSSYQMTMASKIWSSVRGERYERDERGKREQEIMGGSRWGGSRCEMHKGVGSVQFYLGEPRTCASLFGVFFCVCGCDFILMSGTYSMCVCYY